MSHIVVIGGGVTGLVAALRLQNLMAGHRITIVEKTSRLGGKIHTARVEDIVLDGGADSLISLPTNPAASELCAELGLSDDLQPMRTANINIRRDGTLYPIPLEGGVIPVDPEPLAASGLLSPDGVAAIAEDLAIRPAGGEEARAGEGGIRASGETRVAADDEPVSTFMRRHFGVEYAARVAEPLMSSFYASDPNVLSMEALYPQLRRLEERYGSLIAGAKAMGGAASTSQKLSLRSGMGTLIDALREALTEVEVLMERSVRAVEEHGSGYRVHFVDETTMDADAVVVATPAPAVARIVSRLDPLLADTHRLIDHASVVNINLVYDQRHISTDMEGSGYLVPTGESGKLPTCMWTSRVWENRAPEGMAQIRAFFGRPGTDPLVYSDDELIGLARAELSRTLGVSLEVEPRLYRIFRWRDAFPEYTLGHLERVATIDARLEAHPGLFFAGAAYRGLGIHDCIASAGKAAQACADHLAQPATT